MKNFSLKQSAKNNTTVIVFTLLFLSYFFTSFIVKKLSDIVFQEPVIFEGAGHVEKIVRQALGVQINSNNNLSVVYFWKNDCPCNIGVVSHYSSLFDDYSNRGVDFYVADLSGNKKIPLSSSLSSPSLPSHSRRQPKGLVLETAVSNTLMNHVKYTPAIAVFNAKKELLYYGPHSLGFICNVRTSVVQKVIASAQQNVFSKSTNVIGEGCFCRTSTER